MATLMVTGIIMAQSDQASRIGVWKHKRVRVERRTVQLKTAFIVLFDGLNHSKFAPW